MTLLWTFGVVSALVLVTLIAVSVVAFCRAYALKKRNQNCPVVTVKAKLIALDDKAEQINKKNIDCFIALFEDETGAPHKFFIDRSEFTLLCVGDEGALTYQGVKYICFIKN